MKKNNNYFYKIYLIYKMENEFIEFTFRLINNTNDIINYKNFESEEKYIKDYFVNIREIRPLDEFIIKFKIRTNKELTGEIIFDKTSFIIKNYLQSNSNKSEFKLYEYESKYFSKINSIMKYQPMANLLQYSKISFDLIEINPVIRI